MIACLGPNAAEIFKRLGTEWTGRIKVTILTRD